jgi:hypothetical protein
MKNVIILAAVLMLFGCVTVEAPEANETIENVTVEEEEEQPVMEEEKIVETFAIESVNGVFQHTDYEFADNSNPFSDGVGGDLGKTSTAYIKVNEDDLGFLSGDCKNEQQAFWFNLKTREGKGVIFEAVYGVDLEGDCERIKLLGKEYTVEVIDKPESEEGKIARGGEIRLTDVDSGALMTLKDGSGFNRDDRWPVVLGWKDGELVKIIVYMGGYFYDIEADTSVVPLFASENRVLARFTDMETNPTFELITTDMTKVKKN